MPLRADHEFESRTETKHTLGQSLDPQLSLFHRTGQLYYLVGHTHYYLPSILAAMRLFDSATNDSASSSAALAACVDTFTCRISALIFSSSSDS